MNCINVSCWLLNKGTLFYTKRYFLLSVMEMDVGRWEQIGVKLEGKKTRWLLFWRDFNFHCEWRGVFEYLRTFHIHFLLFFYYRSASCRVPRCIELDIDICYFCLPSIDISLATPSFVVSSFSLQPIFIEISLNTHLAIYLMLFSISFYLFQ